MYLQTSVYVIICYKIIIRKDYYVSKMIYNLKGTVELKKESYVVIDVNGIGYKVSMPEATLQDIELNKQVKVFTYMRVSEDEINLYGFLTNEELAMFELLISVGGIGSKSALKILSNITPSKFALAVVSNDVGSLKKLPGIGAKTAQRIILELKDKMKTEEAIEDDVDTKDFVIEGNEKDALEALQVLGYQRRDIESVFDKIDTKGLSVEEIIKLGLKRL